ncbi:MAG TPA: NAD-dependent epimerase/dehydratase family protein, partial [Acidimicrobiales bacterium]|nr:NAD-dependent epimerase/dehydratase family protein [Acidimicrobiales bacterium]
MTTSDRPRPENVVVTGANGWLGQNLVRALVGERERVRCLVRDRHEATLLSVLGSTIQPVVGDVRDPSALDALFEGVGAASVFHA